MGLLADLLNEIPTTGVAHERMALAMEKAAAIEADLIRLKDENARLTGELAAARQFIPRPEFVEAYGVLFKRRAGGGFEPVAYCPDCRRALARKEAKLACTKCNFVAPFHRRDLRGAIARLQT